ncbi:MAG: phosphomannomutase/phosphoglucomutase [Candidatus Dependentiae bacterium]|jgi:phosphomannomutase
MKSPQHFDPTIFRRYDIRGTLPTQFSTISAYAIAQGIITYYREQDPTLHTLVLGRDGRTTSPALANVVRTVCREQGIAVFDLGLCSSPEFYYEVTGLSTSESAKESGAGIMITASHNNAEYNGFKLRLHGKPVWGDQLQQIKVHALAAATTPARSDYVTALLKQFTHLGSFAPHVVIDCSGGAAGPAVRDLCEALQLKNITLLNDTPDGTFAAHAPDPTKKENLSHLINLITSAKQPTFGLALDGDGDRLVLVLEDGTHCAGDELLALLATPVLEKNPGAHVVYESKSSRRLIDHVTNLGGVGHLVPCGHTYIHDAMSTHQALLGGEVSGHLFFADRYHGYDDGIYALLRVLELRQQQGALVAQYAQLPTAYASKELRIPCMEESKKTIIDSLKREWQALPAVRLDEQDGIRAEFTDGWVLVRPSHTEPVLSARCEGASKPALQRLEKELGDLLTELIRRQ